ncbi:PqqD family protein [Acidobacteria bacterium AB60]|nr:PqqD family protein [Acidobacteria bacterium AB60]
MVWREEELVLVSEPTHLRSIVNEDGAAILDIKSGRITTLNTSGGYVWQALENGEEIETIAASLARETDQDLEAVRRDVADFVEALKKQDLLAG